MNLSGKIVVVIILLTPAFMFGQEETKSVKRLKAIGINFSPHYSFRDLNYPSAKQWVADIRDQNEIPKFGFTTGAHLRYWLWQNLNLETGLFYSDKGEKTKPVKLNWVSSDNGLPVTSRTIYHFQYIELPIRFNYVIFQKNRLNYFAMAGVSLGLFISKKTTYILEYNNQADVKHTSSRYIGYLKFNSNSILSIGIDYQVSKRLTCRLEPVYQRSLISVVADDSAKEFFYSVGINFGVYYSLKEKE